MYEVEFREKMKKFSISSPNSKKTFRTSIKKILEVFCQKDFLRLEWKIWDYKNVNMFIAN